MTAMGWCMDGHHRGVPDLEGKGDGCPGENPVTGRPCSCACHDVQVMNDVQAYARTRTEQAERERRQAS